jgi:m7GpppX diphosphatase
MRTHFHYHPSFYHLHVHVTHSNQESPSLKVERSHMLDAVIENIGMVEDYYQKVTLEFALRDGEPLYKHIKESG